MISDLTAHLTAADVAEIVESVFAAMMGLELASAAAPWFPGPDRLTAAVQLLAEEWTGAVLLECDSRQARCFAGRFLSTDPPGGVNDCVRDVLGELANMIGGNLKSAMSPGIRLSLPSVVDGSDYRLRLCGAQTRESLAFHCPEGVFWIAILCLQR